MTPDNFQELGSAFIGMFGGAVISLREGESGGVKFGCLPRQWGAWRAYFKRKGIETRFMDARGREGKAWTVPAEWPHEFDAEATFADDIEAGESFWNNYRPERLDLADKAARLQKITAYKAKKAEWFAKEKREATPVEHLAMPKPWHDDSKPPSSALLKQIAELDDTQF